MAPGAAVPAGARRPSGPALQSRPPGLGLPCARSPPEDCGRWAAQHGGGAAFAMRCGAARAHACPCVRDGARHAASQGLMATMAVLSRRCTPNPLPGTPLPQQPFTSTGALRCDDAAAGRRGEGARHGVGGPWWVPLRYVASSRPEAPAWAASPLTACAADDAPLAVLQPGGGGGGAATPTPASPLPWIKLNAGALCPYRVAYSDAMWARLADAAASPARLPCADDVASLIDDASALAAAGEAPVAALLNLTRALGRRRVVGGGVAGGCVGRVDGLDGVDAGVGGGNDPTATATTPASWDPSLPAFVPELGPWKVAAPALRRVRRVLAADGARAACVSRLDAFVRDALLAPVLDAADGVKGGLPGATAGPAWSLTIPQPPRPPSEAATALRLLRPLALGLAADFGDGAVGKGAWTALQAASGRAARRGAWAPPGDADVRGVLYSAAVEAGGDAAFDAVLEAYGQVGLGWPPAHAPPQPPSQACGSLSNPLPPPLAPQTPHNPPQTLRPPTRRSDRARSWPSPLERPPPWPPAPWTSPCPTGCVPRT